MRTHHQPEIKIEKFYSPLPLPHLTALHAESEGPDTDARQEITELHTQHSTYRSDRHVQVRDSLGTARRHELV